MNAPTGVLAERVEGELADLARVMGRLETHAVAGSSGGLTMDLFAFLRHFVTGHYHEHADQLDGLRSPQ